MCTADLSFAASGRARKRGGHKLFDAQKTVSCRCWTVGPRSVRELQKDHQGAKSNVIALESLYSSLSLGQPHSHLWHRRAGGGPEPSFKQAFIGARMGYLVWYTSNWKDIMAFNIIDWGWEPTHKPNLFSCWLVAVREWNSRDRPVTWRCRFVGE